MSVLVGLVGSAEVTMAEQSNCEHPEKSSIELAKKNQGAFMQRFMCIVVTLVLPCIIVTLVLPCIVVTLGLPSGYFSVMCEFTVRLGVWILGNNLLVFAHHLHQREKNEEITAQKIKEQTGLVRALGVANFAFVHQFACFWILREIFDPQTDNPNEGIASQFQRIFEYVVDVIAVVILIAHAPARHAPC